MSSSGSSEQPNGPNKLNKRPPRRNFRRKTNKPKKIDDNAPDQSSDVTKISSETNNKTVPTVENKRPSERQTKKPSEKKPKNKTKNSRNNKSKARNKVRRDADQGFKLVLRHLPPNLTEEEFMDNLKPVIQDKKLSTFGIIDNYYRHGSIANNLFEKSVYSRAYFTFNLMEQLKEFGNNVRTLTFIDDKDNVSNPVLKVSPYVKKLGNSNVSNRKHSKKLEGTIENDPIFKQFLKTIKLMGDKDDSSYAFNNISIFKSLEKELAKEKKIDALIEKKTELAMIKLSGVDVNKMNEKKKKKKEKKKKKKKEKKANEVEDSGSVSKKKKKEKTSKKKSKQKKDKTLKKEDKNKNIVILEEAGKRELKNRMKILQEKEKKTLAMEKRLEMVNKAREQQMLLRKAKEEEAKRSDNVEHTPRTQPVKLLKHRDK
ncbi:similar to Saccharomyces cerevisiae YGR072W UPF3 Component of the nonsense-mediated mRNA decay (NMD) pathway, along with Nam7p and Nmd2p [Maudiozyma barnettii]|uniref:Similar to Saccharomyces cerevisiae YGR072W UPF3 Component of the nonsense-mediated mRNA decay (NMD) pathway, along with Nam7p and Nmd2p n=1 Tax=Maudiozyma barnettii TaxID=61262 RepID=A0A8H2ZJN1_9SACH|nr:Upf3p [Kazachstania barnettii]CAB4257213.1 similar to Saccharomyces cerevisiae YGR072W UPF3 Component of the nonsense-mediated mRNA decay (NMD) pathway, along with Nam7p and Nmd2p [Kazachstania barnettii]CAD1779583.1 similar to Saccharomyces cerevisiae YGR072W UPF3 Component of the nonsense-mediated mRNA decay (NMD) pathway, along with Nam7p and Nmd2p [Kazachstania barnettii]